MSARIVLLVTSPRLPVGLLTAEAWDLVRGTPVFAAAESGQTAALRAAGVSVTISERPLDDLLAAGDAVWLVGPSGDPELTRELGLRLAREPSLAVMELRYGSWDPPGARLLDAVTVMDRLVSPGGDPWKRAQTHQSLARFLLEEAYEAYDAIEAEDYAALREELGDVLLQVVLHARLAQQLPDERAWNVDDVAGDLRDQEGGEGARLGARRGRPVPARARAGRAGPGPGPAGRPVRPAACWRGAGRAVAARGRRGW